MDVRDAKDPKTKELLVLMRRNSLNARQVGKIVGRSRQTVKRWTGEFTIIDQSMLDLLKYRLEDQSAKRS